MNDFFNISTELQALVKAYTPILLTLPTDVITNRRNRQERTIKQIVGHMVDSASNNTHRAVHLQYQPSPLQFPDYAHFGNNDRWIAIQNYQEENWEDLVQLWKFSHHHYAHIIQFINPEKLDNIWTSALNEDISLKMMVNGYLSHFKLHWSEIEDLIRS